MPTAPNLFFLCATLSISASASTINFYTSTQALLSINGSNDYEPNGLFATSTFSDPKGEANYAYANLNTGRLGVQSTGNVPGGSAGQNAPFTLAEFADSISAVGNTRLLNLGVNLTINGSSTLGNPAKSLTAVVLEVYAPGFLDGTTTTQLFGEGFVVGNGTMSYAPFFTQHGLSYGGTYGTGTQTLPLNIPFSTIGSNFVLDVGLFTTEDSTILPGDTWNIDYSHTLTASLSAPAGITLVSGSGVLPGTVSSTPEPGSIALFAGGLLAISVSKYCRSKHRWNCRAAGPTTKP